MKHTKPGDLYNAFKKKTMKKPLRAPASVQAANRANATARAGGGKYKLNDPFTHSGGMNIVPVSSRRDYHSRAQKFIKGARAAGRAVHAEDTGELIAQKKKPKVKKKNWIKGAIKHPGALHRELGVPKGKKIPPGKLAAAAKKGGKIGRRARLAETLKGLHKKTMPRAPRASGMSTGVKVNGRPVFLQKTMCKKHGKKMCKTC